MVRYPLVGGLDLVTVKPLARPGTLSECLNYEVATKSGYTRINGVARFDGSEDVGNYKLWRLKYAGVEPGFVAGMQAWFDPALKGVILEVSVVEGNGVIYLMVPGIHGEPALPATLTTDTVTASIQTREAVFKGYGTQDTFDAALTAIENEQRDRIGTVPGRVGSDIIGGFFYKDRVYVIRDLPRIGFEDGYYTDSDEGKYITIGGQEFKVLDVAITGDGVGTLTYDTEAGSGTDAAPLGAATLVELSVTGDYGSGYTSVPYEDDLDVTGGTGPFTWSLIGDEGTAIDPVESPDANAIAFLPQVTNAALYRSSDDGWERVDLGREMQFRNGTSFLRNFARTAVLDTDTMIDTGFEFPTTGKVAGVTTTNMNSNNGTDAALVAGATVEFQVSGFDFSTIPDTASIQGIEVLVERHSDAGATAKDYLVDLMNVVAGTVNKAQGPVWPVSPTTTTYGGSSDLWGSHHITPAILKDADFGVRIIAAKGGVDTMVGGIDYVQVKVYYTERDSQIFVWDGATDVEFTLQHTQIVSGDPTADTAAGYMTLDGDVNAAKARLVNEGDEIRTAAAGGGNLLGLVGGRDRPIWLAGQAELDHNRSRYQFEKTNFYGQDEFEAVFGVCGASPAFSFDGTRCIRIRTELPAHKDLPRHVTRHGDMLVLGYFPGALVFTAVGDPFETRASEGANALEVGDRLTGLVPLAGDALGIVCQSQTSVVRGTTPETMFKSGISSKRGGIEYTVVDMGRAVLCDGLGVFLADSPESFGAAARSYASQAVHPWLRPRLQAKLSSEDAYLRPVVALNVRHKNQMRLYFWDGWVLTMTMLGDVPEFTTQRYYTPAPDEHTEPTPWTPRMICSGIDSSGRERIFCSFYGGIKSDYVFELDVGRNFDGEPIPAEVVLNPLTVSDSASEKRYDKLFLYGQGHTWASLTYSRKINDGDSFSGTYEFTMGKGSKTATLEPNKMRGVIDSPVEAFDISIRFESETASEGSHTLQYIQSEADHRGDSRGRQGDK